jgi:hypothetical protein
MRDTGQNPADGIKITDGQRRLLDLVGSERHLSGVSRGYEGDQGASRGGLFRRVSAAWGRRLCYIVGSRRVQ